jgi:hypothetical protein
VSALSVEQRRFLVIGQSAVPFLINVVLNAGIGWAMFRGMATVPFWGESSIGGDTLGTAFFLPAITCLIVTPLVRGQVRKGQAPKFDDAAAGWLRPFRLALPLRAVALGAVSIPLAGGAGIALLSALGVETLGFGPFLGWKALYSGVLAALIQPAIALLALTDRPGR